jgi:hypothetical protein
MQNTASNQNNEQSRRALEKAREIGAGQDPAAENLKKEALGRLQAHDKNS